MTTDSTHEPRARRSSRVRVPLAIAALLAMVALAACGSSSSNSTTGVKAAASTTSSKGSNRFSALRECLQKQGITLPSRPAGGGPATGTPPSGVVPPAGGAPGFKLPQGVSRAKFQEALKKCGGGFRFGRRRPNSAASKAALAKFASCMRENGVNLPAPNTSGKGPVFDTKGIDTTSSKFKSAQIKCRSPLKGAFGGPRGTAQGGGPPGGAPAGGQPPAGGEAGGEPSESS